MAKLEFTIPMLPSGQYLHLSDILAVLNPRANGADWEVGYAGDTEFWAMGKDVTALHALVESKERISGEALDRLLQDVHQIVWGKFRAFDGPVAMPWVTISFMDSSWIEIDADEEAVITLFREHYNACPPK